MKSLKLVFFLISLFGFLFSCKKKKDDELPKIVVLSPASAQKFDDNSYVDFIINITDNKSIETLKVNIVDVDKRLVSSTVTEFPKVKEYKWINYVTIDASKITSSGTYYLNIKASDGFNEASVFLPIYIYETQLHKKAIYIISNELAKGAEIQKLDSLNNLSVFTRLTGDYLASAISNKFKQIYTCGNYEGPFQAIDTRTATSLWKQPVVYNKSRNFSALYASNDVIYLGFYEGFIYGFNEKGKAILSTQKSVDVNYYAEKICRTENYFVAYEIHKSENKKRLKTFYLNGNAKQELYIDFEPICILVKDKNKCYILAKKETEAKLYVFDLENNSYYNPTIISGTITSVCIANSKVVYCDGTSILTYDEAKNSLVILKQNFIADKMEYDVTTNELIVLRNGIIYLLDFSNGNIKKSIAVNSNASDILLQLSK